MQTQREKAENQKRLKPNQKEDRRMSENEGKGDEKSVEKIPEAILH